MSDFIDVRVGDIPVASIEDDTPMIAMFKRNFRKSLLDRDDFDIDPFSFNSMSDWYQAVRAEEDPYCVHGTPNGTPSDTPPNAKTLSNNALEHPSSVQQQTQLLRNEPQLALYLKPFTNSQALADSTTILESTSTPAYSTGDPPKPSPPIKQESLSPLPLFDIQNIAALRPGALPSFPGYENPPNSPRYSPSSNSDKENQGPVIPSSANDFKPQADHAPVSSDSTITDPDLPASARVDFKHQEPSFEHASEPVLPPLPGASLRQPPVWTPIIDRRLTSCHGIIQKAHQSITDLSHNISTNTTSKNANPKKRSADESRTPRTKTADKRPRNTHCDAVIDHINEMLGLKDPNPQPSSASTFPRAPSYSPITINIPSSPVAPSYSLITINQSSPVAPSYSLITINQPSDTDLALDIYPRTPPPLPVLPTPLTANFKTYPGQFHALTHRFMTRNGRQPEFFTFPEPGCHTNANGHYTNTRMVAARASQRLDYSARFRAGKWRKTTQSEETLFAELEAKTLLAGSDQVAEERLPKDVVLRSRLHHEASQARILGVSVGELRYYEGHLTIEECVEMGVCVCWERCACSAVCTRFPDMLCPCSEEIEMEQS